ncbi:MAG: class I SAM-dependent methyltransferase, partial [Verrucomicrobiales bacterium]|nr:class I SAM-dependent methyltransferase [Verrucomicrobiales bacterium]
FIGTDIRDREIERAAERCGKGEDGVDYRFMVKDGQKLTQDADLAEGFDVVFVRHQNYYLGGKEWHAIFEQSLEKLAPDGKLIITSYFDHEHDLAKDAIQKVGGELIDEIANQEARSLATKGKFVDKRLAMFRRRD